MNEGATGSGGSSPARGDWIWLPATILPIPVGLAVWRAVGLGLGTADLAPHLLLDLLVTATVVPLLAGPIRSTRGLPSFFSLVLVALALYVGWLYLPAGSGTALFLFAVVLGTGIALRILRKHLSLATFLRSGWMIELGLTGGDVPADAVYTRDPLTGGHAKTWRRYVALPIILGLFLGFVALRIARPLDKRAEAQVVLDKNDPFEIGRAFLKAATNGNAPLFVRERAVWFAAEERRGEVMVKAGELFASYRDELGRLDLQWIDLGTLPPAELSGAGPPRDPARDRRTYAGRTHGWAEEPEALPDDLAWVDSERRYKGLWLYLAPIEVALEKSPDGWRVTDVSTDVGVSLRRPQADPN